MYYKCKIHPTELTVYVNEEDFDVIVDYLLNVAACPLIIGYLTDEEVMQETNNCFIELKCTR